MKLKYFIVVLVLLIAACGGSDKKAKLADLKKQRDEINKQISAIEAELATQAGVQQTTAATRVGTVPIKLEVFEHYVEVQGKLDGDENVAISPTMAGTVIARYVNVGSVVQKGQVLAQIDDAIYQKQLKSLQTSYELAKDVFEKQDKLWAQKIGSEMQYLQAKANKEGLEQQIGTLKEQIDMMKIKSPINGTVAEANLKVGQLASPALPIPAFRVVNFGKLRVLADVAEAYGAKIKKGDVVKLFFPDINLEQKTQVTYASDYINPTNRTFQVEIQMNDKSSLYKANMICVVKIKDYSNEKAVIIPISLISSDMKSNYVYVAVDENGKKVARKRTIAQGQSYNGTVEITEGLKEGDLLITQGYQDLEDGDPIQQ